ncbi:hypothetical protein EVAR_48168_1 [Eumeta japonica]|uniref:Uncharacterized protein n=1 Tax=Eumeta variegata TaxID=151549 RepID=A0A4C1WPJ7_EUMVA|nr:hypothetical protein EVAR_48168_1 [Eumeta japonica]
MATLSTAQNWAGTTGEISHSHRRRTKEVADSSVAFRPANESSGCPLAYWPAPPLHHISYSFSRSKLHTGDICEPRTLNTNPQEFVEIEEVPMKKWKLMMKPKTNSDLSPEHHLLIQGDLNNLP